MSFRNGDKRSAAGRTYLIIYHQFGLNGCTVLTRFDHMSLETNCFVTGRWPQQLYVKIRCDRAVGLVFTVTLHQEKSRSPVGVTVKESTDNAAIQHPWKCLVMRLSMPFGNHLVTIWITVDMQALFICRAASETYAIG